MLEVLGSTRVGWAFDKLPYFAVVPISALTPKAVRLYHFARFAQWVRSARMLVMQEDRKLRSYRFTLRGHRLLK